MWGYGQCLDTIKGIVMELNSLFSMLIELLTNDSLLQSATNTVPDLVSAKGYIAHTVRDVLSYRFLHENAAFSVGDMGKRHDAVSENGRCKGLRG